MRKIFRERFKHEVHTHRPIRKWEMDKAREDDGISREALVKNSVDTSARFLKNKSKWETTEFL